MWDQTYLIYPYVINLLLLGHGGGFGGSQGGFGGVGSQGGFGGGGNGAGMTGFGRFNDGGMVIIHIISIIWIK